MKPPKVSLGVVSYGNQPPSWWKAMIDLVGNWDRSKVEYGELFHSGVSTTDINRNNVSNAFLKSDSDYLLWIDADNPPPMGTVERLLEPGHELVSGLYYGGNMDTEMKPIAYVVGEKGGYHSLDQVRRWNKGEILPVDAVGMGCFLTHRSVYEDILKNYSMYQRQSGGILLIHNDKVKGEVPELEQNHPYAGQVRKGILYDPIIQYDMSHPKFPFFMCQYNRTEDYVFCECARELGYMIWVDTLVEVGHAKTALFGGKHFREQNSDWYVNNEIQEVDYEGA